MLSTLFAMGIVFIIIGIAVRLAFGISFEDPFAFIQISPPTDIPTFIGESLEYLIKFTSSMLWTIGFIITIIGLIKR